MKQKIFSFFLLCFFLCGFTACKDAALENGAGSASATEDNSGGAAAAEAVGGSIAGSDSNGQISLYPQPRNIWSSLLTPAIASTACPTIKTTLGSGCTANGSAVDLTYAGCTFLTPALWTGSMEVSLSSGFATTTITCGTFPDTTTLGAGQTIQRQFVAAAAPSSGNRHTDSEDVIVDHGTANLGNFDTVAIAPTIGTGYGTQVFFDGAGHRTGLVVNELVSSAKFSHSISGTLSISESGATRTVNTITPLKIYHNVMQIIGSSTFTQVVYTGTCCQPTSGTITTTFTAGTIVTPPNAEGSAHVGRTQTLKFTGCGTATLADVDGLTKNVLLSRCF